MKTVIDKKDNRKELIEEIQSVLLSIAEDKNLSVDKIILFGSIARGDFNENSDIDLFIVSDDWDEGETGRGTVISRQLPRDWPHTDVICRTPGEMSEGRDKPRALENLNREGLVIVKDNEKVIDFPSFDV